MNIDVAEVADNVACTTPNINNVSPRIIIGVRDPYTPPTPITTHTPAHETVRIVHVHYHPSTTITPVVSDSDPTTNVRTIHCVQPNKAKPNPNANIIHKMISPINASVKQCNTTKPQIPRIESQTWNLSTHALEITNQKNAVNNLFTFARECSCIKTPTLAPTDCACNVFGNLTDSYARIVLSHIRAKRHGYRSQDLSKSLYKIDEFISLAQTIQLLHESECMCYYCSRPVYALYEMSREPRQWTLDRVDNDHGHNKTNVIIACYECNIKRRKQNKDLFLLDKNMVLERVGFNNTV